MRPIIPPIAWRAMIQIAKEMYRGFIPRLPPAYSSVETSLFFTTLFYSV